MIIIAGKLYVEADTRAEYLEGAHTVVELARAAPGCLDYALSADLSEPERINVYERWESDAAVETFRRTGPAVGQTVAIREADVRRYRVAGDEAA